jgi:hypothetical protein
MATQQRKSMREPGATKFNTKIACACVTYKEGSVCPQGNNCAMGNRGPARSPRKAAPKPTGVSEAPAKAQAVPENSSKKARKAAALAGAKEVVEAEAKAAALEEEALHAAVEEEDAAAAAAPEGSGKDDSDDEDYKVGSEPSASSGDSASEAEPATAKKRKLAPAKEPARKKGKPILQPTSAPHPKKAAARRPSSS